MRVLACVEIATAAASSTAAACLSDRARISESRTYSESRYFRGDARLRATVDPVLPSERVADVGSDMRSV